MSEYDRGHVPPEDEERFNNQAWQIYFAIREAPKTNVQIRQMGLDHSRRVYELLAKHGIYIRSERVPGSNGVWLYSLRDGPDPEYDVGMRAMYTDGYTHLYTVTVNADNVSKAKNKAQHAHVKRKVMWVRKAPDDRPPTPPPYWPQLNGGGGGEASDTRHLYDQIQALRTENHRLYMLSEKLRDLLAKVHKRWSDARKDGEDSGQKTP